MCTYFIFYKTVCTTLYYSRVLCLLTCDHVGTNPTPHIANVFFAAYGGITRTCFKSYLVTISLLLFKLDKIANTLTTSKKRTFEKQFNKHKLKWINEGMRKRDCNFRTAKTVSLKLYSLWQNYCVQIYPCYENVPKASQKFLHVLKTKKLCLKLNI